MLAHSGEQAVFKTELQGMKIPLNRELQALLDDDNSGTSLERILPDMTKKSEDCYRSLLGFYWQRFRALRVRHSSDMVVEMINEFSDQAMLEKTPSMSFKVAAQFGLTDHPGITIRNSDNYAGDRGGGGGRSGGGSGGYGGGSYSGGRGGGGYSGGRSGGYGGRSSDGGYSSRGRSPGGSRDGGGRGGGGRNFQQGRGSNSFGKQRKSGDRPDGPKRSRGGMFGW